MWFLLFPAMFPVTKEISYEELKALVGKSPKLILIDVRSEEEVAKGHIPGSINIPRKSVLYFLIYIYIIYTQRPLHVCSGDCGFSCSVIYVMFSIFASSLIPSVSTVEGALKMDPDEFKVRYGVTKPQLDAPELVFHCQIGKRGAMATTKAHELGYVNARNYAGAYSEWSKKEGK
uniref:Thiosulfate sulfurtransferase like domain containing 1 n=1 Tax=Oreochromis niloticus TaxID=8128 RepID=A0A669DAJ6_ORENI